MKPDEKYMMDSFRQPDDEMKFKPFDTKNFIPNFQGNVIPVMMWGNLVINPSNMLPSEFNLSNWSNPTLTNNFNTENTSNNPMYSKEKYNSQNLSMGYEGNNVSNMNNNSNMSNANATNYPDETQSSYLYSYNKGNNPPSNPMNINDSDNVNNILRNLNSSIDEDKDLARACHDDKVNKIYNNILNDSNLMSIFKGYEIPKPIIKLIIMGIIKFTLKYCEKGR